MKTIKSGPLSSPLWRARPRSLSPSPDTPWSGPTLSKVNCGHQWAQVGLRQAFCASIPDVMYDTAIHPALGTFGVRTGTVCHAYKKRVPSPRTDLLTRSAFRGFGVHVRLHRPFGLRTSRPLGPLIRLVSGCGPNWTHRVLQTQVPVGAGDRKW